jgi:hypothetical protein
MRKLTLTLAPIILLTFLFLSSAFGETMEDLVKGEGLYYKEFIERPFTGKVTGRSQGWFRRSKKDGPWVKFGDNEQVQFKGNHKNGIRKGPWVGYWNNRQLWFKGTYKDGKEIGPWVVYNEGGTVWDEFTGTYKYGDKVK